MENEIKSASAWNRLKGYIFIKLGYSLWPYVLIHQDYWHKPYGLSFTDRRDFPKLFKYDMVDMSDDIEIEMEKNR